MAEPWNLVAGRLRAAHGYDGPIGDSLTEDAPADELEEQLVRELDEKTLRLAEVTAEAERWRALVGTPVKFEGYSETYTRAQAIAGCDEQHRIKLEQMDLNSRLRDRLEDLADQVEATGSKAAELAQQLERRDAAGDPGPPPVSHKTWPDAYRVAVDKYVTVAEAMHGAQLRLEDERRARRDVEAALGRALTDLTQARQIDEARIGPAVGAMLSAFTAARDDDTVPELRSVLLVAALENLGYTVASKTSGVPS